MKFLRFITLYLIINVSSLSFIYSQQPASDIELIELGKKYLDLVKQKSQSYQEVDSIYYYTTEAKTLFEQAGHDSLIYEANSDLIYWHTLQNETQKVKELIEYNLNKLSSVTKHQNIRSYLAYTNVFNKGIYSNVDSCIYFSHKAYELVKDTEDNVHHIIAMQNLINCFLSFNDSLSLIPKYANKILELEDIDAETKSLAKSTHVDLGKYYIRTGQYNKAITQLLPQSLLESNSNNFGFTIFVNEFLEEAYYKSGNYTMAYNCTKTIRNLQSQFSDQQKIQAIENAKFTFDTEQKEQLISQLQKSNYIKDQQSQKQIILLAILGLATAFILFLLFTLHKNNKIKLDANQKLLDYQANMSSMKSRLFTNITHEFRTPLTVILGVVSKIKGNSSEKEAIKRNGNQLLNMVNQLLDLSMAETGNLSVNFIQSNIIKYIEYLVESHIIIADKKNIRLVFHSEMEELTMDYDEQFIKYICTNLLSNALKFTPYGGKIIVLSDLSENEFTLRVKDSGIGIQEKDLPYIFDRFYQTDPNAFGGTGIGLALVKEIVDLLEGRVKVKSTIDFGTEFIISIPITNKAEISEFTGFISAIPKQARSNPDLKYLEFNNNDKIALIVEDNEDVQNYIESCIQDQYKVKKAADGVAGLNIAKDIIPDIIISDIMMPNMDGYEMCSVLKNDFRTCHIPIILLTAKATQSDKLEGLETGADAYLIKPFDEEELQIRIQQLIQLRNTLKNKYLQHQKEGTKEETHDPFLKSLLKIMEDQFSNETFGIKELCHALHLSRMQVHRKIKALTDLSTSQFLNDFRLQKSKELLCNTHLNISEIAYACGYEDPRYFSRLFKEKFGVPPSQS